MECDEKVHNRFRHNGEQYDPLTSQYYLRARFYNPVIARFTQEDTYYGDGLNLYQYCANNPIAYVDPSGHNICQTQRDVYHEKCEAYMRDHGLTDYSQIPKNEKNRMFKEMRTELGKTSDSKYKGSGTSPDSKRDMDSGSSNVNGTGARLIPGKEGVVTGGDSDVLGQNLFREMGLEPNSSRTGYQAQHIIPKELRNHPVLQKIGIDLDNASNGMFLRNRDSGGSSATSRHQGYHKQYTQVIKNYLNDMDITKSVSELEYEVYKLQQSARNMMQDGVPIYKRDHVPSSNSKIGRKSEKIYGISGGERTEDFIRRMIDKYEF